MASGANFCNSERTNVKNLSHPLHANALLTAINESRKNACLCDGTVVIGDTKIPVQKNILSAASSYFRALFSYDTPLQDTSNSIKIDTMTQEIFEEILDYVYTSVIQLCEENIQDILQAADVLLMADLKELCCDYLEGLVSPDNCLGIRQFAEQYTCPRVYHTATDYLDEHFMEISFTEEFLQLSPEGLKDVLQRDSLCVRNEDAICESVFRWLRHIPSRVEILPDILKSSVRLAHIGDKFINEEIKDEHLGLILKVKELRNLILSAPKSEADCKLRGYTTVIVGSGGEGENSEYTGVVESKKTVQFIVPHNDSTARAIPWVDLADMTTPRVSHSLVEAGGYLFAVGGRDSNGRILNSGEKYDPISNEWTTITPMSQARIGFGLVTVDNKIYAIGGSNDMSDPLTSVEEYNIYTNKWRKLPDMNLKRAWSAFAVANKKIYVIGGGIMGKLYEAVECFDPKSETWTSVSPMKERRFDARAIGVDDYVFIFGGLRRLECPSASHGNGTGMKFCGTEVYNIEEKNWKTMAASSQAMCTMTETSHIDGLVHIGDEIFIVGELDIGGVHQYTRAFNYQTQHWRGVLNNHPPCARNMPVAALKLPNAVIYKHLWQQNKLRFSDLRGNNHISSSCQGTSLINK